MKHIKLADLLIEDEDVFKKHQKSIAKRTLKMPNAIANVMGGMNKKTAKDVLAKKPTKKEAVGPLTPTSKKDPGNTVEFSKFVTQAEKFLKAMQTAADKYYSKEYPTLNKPKFSFDRGNKYWRIVKDNGAQRMAYGFLDSRTGDILKTAGWKAPAKGVRGNIFDADMGYNATTPYGIRYFK